MVRRRIGNLVIDISGNVAKISKDMAIIKSRVNSGMKSISKTVDYAKKAIAGIVGAYTLKQFAGWQKEIINAADDLGKMAKRTGIAAEELSRLEYAAQLSGTSISEMRVGLRRLARNMYDANKGTGEARRAFEELGIKVANTDGKLKSTRQIISELADKFHDMADGTQKSAYASLIFGRSGEALIPMLNEGARGLREMGDEASKLGGVISNELSRQSEDFNDNMTRISTSLKGVGIASLNNAIPALNSLTDAFVKGAKEGGILNGVLKSMSKFVTVGLLGGGEAAKKDMERLIEYQQELKKLKGYAEKANKSLVFYEMAGNDEAIERQMSLIDGYMSKMDELKRKIDDIGSKYHQSMRKRSIETKKLNKKKAQEIVAPLPDTAYLKQAKQITDMRLKEEQKAREQQAKAAEQFRLEQEQLEAQHLEAMKTEYQRYIDAIKGVTNNWSRDFTESIVEMTQTGKLNFKDMVTSMLGDMVRMSSMRVFQPAFQRLFGGLVGRVMGNRPPTPMEAFSLNDLPAFATGGIVNGPTLATVGERGAEAIMPLMRSGGQLGVKGQVPKVIIENIDQRSQGAPIEQTQSTMSDGTVVIRQIIRDEVKSMVRTGVTDNDFMAAYGLSRTGFRRG